MKLKPLEWNDSNEAELGDYSIRVRYMYGASIYEVRLLGMQLQSATAQTIEEAKAQAQEWIHNYIIQMYLT